MAELTDNLKKNNFNAYHLIFTISFTATAVFGISEWQHQLELGKLERQILKTEFHEEIVQLKNELNIHISTSEKDHINLEAKHKPIWERINYIDARIDRKIEDLEILIKEHDKLNKKQH